MESLEGIEHQKRYDYKAIEEKWTKMFSQAFRANPTSSKRKFCITIPPPNITGSLHIGHALNMTIQDILVRYKRMCDYEVLWVPGTDHAGIATQVVVLRELEKKGIKREELSEEEFLKFVEEWKEYSQSRIREQMEKLALSVDWSMNRFTLDPQYKAAVMRAFFELYNAGLIYRGDYIINWCPSCKTALSDLEVEFEDEAGKLYYIIYPIEERGSFGIQVATTRPETLLGDTAVAVHPLDQRYSEIKAVYVPLVWRKVPVIRDERVDMTFGTGAVKITPSHDFVDFEIARDHNLPRIKIMDENGVITFGEYKGLDRFTARKRIIEDLKEMKLLAKVEDYKIRIGRCYRCKTIVEPILSRQWFLKMEKLAKEAIAAVERTNDDSPKITDEREKKQNGENRKKVKFLSKNWENLYISWMSRIKDWCISRQLWWGHRIPIATCMDCGRDFVTQDSPPSACPFCSSNKLKEEKDVLDTWFSSALWPFAVLGWPEKTPYLEHFYPTDILVTGFDIIFFWVARMIMMGLFLTKDVPFRYVYVHGLIRDEKGQKMSKTKGNVLDPLEIIDKYGADTLRFTLAVLASQVKDIKLSEKTIQSFYHFMNKIWNASRFVIMNVDTYRSNFQPKSIPQIWIIGRLSRCISRVREFLDEAKINQAAIEIYEFFWNDFCDWYIEISKHEIQNDELRESTQSTLVYVLDKSLRILHVFCPSITAHIWNIMKRKYASPEWNQDMISFAEFPKPLSFHPEAVEIGDTLVAAVREIRSLKNYMGLKSSDLVRAKIGCHSLEILSAINSNRMWMEKLSGSKIEPCLNLEMERNYIPSPVRNVLVMLEAGEERIEEVRRRMEKEKMELSAELERVKRRLSNPDFIAKAEEEIVEEHKRKFEELSFRLSHITRQLEMMSVKN